MKKYFLIVMSAFLVFSCSDEDFAELNTDPINPPNVSADALFNSATISLFDQMESTNVNRNIFRLLAQYWTQTSYIDESNFNINNRNIPDNHWDVLYRNVLFNLKDAKEHVLADQLLSQDEKDGRVAQITFLEVYTWQILVDTFGNIPYSEAFKGIDNPTPAYDDANDIYVDLLKNLDEAIQLSVGSSSGFDDVNYHGNMDKWNKFGNSLKLKLAMRIADVDTNLAKTKAQEAYNDGVFNSLEDNFNINYEATNPNTNPLWNDLVESGRSDFVVANTFVDVLNQLNDPRRAVFFDDNISTGYKGGVYGDSNSFSKYTHIGKILHEPTFRGVLLDYTEVNFYLAEAAARGWSVGNSAEDYYDEAILSSFEEWGVDSNEANNYINQADVAYTTASGNWKEKIGLQFWISMYNRGFEGWSVWRKFNTPTLNIPADTGSPVPLRYTYPQAEHTLNEANYLNASSAIGGDTQQTPVFWDK